jgi:transcriptional regulator with XRE-family HTH domain
MKEKPDKSLKNLGLLIKKIRTEKGLSIIEFGYLIEMDKPNVSRLENGNTNPTFLTLLRICKALEIELTVLFKDFEVPKKDFE